MSRTLTASALGPTPYRDGLALQHALVHARATGATGDWLLFPDHPPVLTVGRSGNADSLRVDADTLDRLGIELVEVTRGGDVTWHGPGQLVGYLIRDLSEARDVHRLLRDLEGALCDALAAWGIEGRAVPGRTGVWVGDDKIASIGVAVRKWVSYHGFALNVAPDLRSFDLIHPCGLRGIRMVSLASLLGATAPDLAEARARMAEAVAVRFGYPALEWAPATAPWSAAGAVPPGVAA